jgi:hypothetical protein
MWPFIATAIVLIACTLVTYGLAMDWYWLHYSAPDWVGYLVAAFLVFNIFAYFITKNPPAN